MNGFQILFVPFCLLAALGILWRAARGQLSRRQALLWAGVWFAGALLVARPATATQVASWLGIGRGADLVFYCAIFGGLWACLYFYTRYRRLEVLLTELIRRECVRQPKRGGANESGDAPSAKD